MEEVLVLGAIKESKGKVLEILAVFWFSGFQFSADYKHNHSIHRRNQVKISRLSSGFFQCYLNPQLWAWSERLHIAHDLSKTDLKCYGVAATLLSIYKVTKVKGRGFFWTQYWTFFAKVTWMKHLTFVLKLLSRKMFSPEFSNSKRTALIPGVGHEDIVFVTTW